MNWRIGPDRRFRLMPRLEWRMQEYIGPHEECRRTDTHVHRVEARVTNRWPGPVARDRPINQVGVPNIAPVLSNDQRDATTIDRMDATAPPAPVDPAGGEKEGRWLERPKWDRPGADELPPPQEFSAEDIRQLDEFLAQFDD